RRYRTARAAWTAAHSSWRCRVRRRAIAATPRSCAERPPRLLPADARGSAPLLPLVTLRRIGAAHVASNLPLGPRRASGSYVLHYLEAYRITETRPRRGGDAFRPVRAALFSCRRGKLPRLPPVAGGSVLLLCAFNPTQPYPQRKCTAVRLERAA